MCFPVVELNTIKGKENKRIKFKSKKIPVHKQKKHRTDINKLALKIVHSNYYVYFNQTSR